MNSHLSDKLWAKQSPWKSLLEHMRETAAVMQCLLQGSIYSGDLPLLSEWLNVTDAETLSLCQYLAAMHDLGKCHPRFQAKDPDTELWLTQHSLNALIPTTGFRHEVESKYAAQRIWTEKERFDKRAGKAFASVLALHHQGKETDNLIRTADTEWIEQQNALEQRLYDAYHPPVIIKKQVHHLDAFCTTLTGLIIIADWIASSDAFTENHEDLSMDALSTMVQNVICNIGLSDFSLQHCVSYDELFPWISPQTIRPLQQGVAQLFGDFVKPPALMILEAPMGEGKTEAGLFAANKMANMWGKKGFYIGLPTAATSNQMVQRADDMLSHFDYGKARLLHSMAWLEQDTFSKDVSSDVVQELDNWLLPSRRALLSPFAVGTVDQVLMAAMHIKYGVIRLLGLTNKVLIIDEIHAYDAYMSKIIERLVEWCRALHVPVIMLSATLPQSKKTKYLSIFGEVPPMRNAYPSVTVAYGDGTILQKEITGTHQQSHTEIRFLKDDTMEQVAERALFLAEHGGCVCVIMNTVAKAQLVYGKLKAKNTDAELMLFHSRFSVARRQEIEKQCLRHFGKDHSNRPKKAILVATQVVEQSLDIDFDAMITEIAPIDLIFQRMGRLHRHQNVVRPETLCDPVLDIVIPEHRGFGTTEKIYCPLFLNRTLQLLQQRTRVSVPEDIPQMVDEVYSDDLMDDEELENWMKQQFDTDMKEGQAQAYELQVPQEDAFGLGGTGQIFHDDSESSFVTAKTRLGEETIHLALVPQLLYEKIRTETHVRVQLAREVMQYSVSVPIRSLRGVEWEESIEGAGKLVGMIIVPCESDSNPTQTIVAHGKNHIVTLDREFGLTIQERGS